MKLLYDFFPVALFFVAYKLYDIYVATAVVMVAALFQTLGYWIKYRRFENLHLITLGIILILGGITLFFHNPSFIKWKPTLVNWLFAGVFLTSGWISEKNLVEHLLSSQIALPKNIWQNLNFAWIIFFIFSGAINLYVAYTFSEETWVNFKLFGMFGLTILFILIQSIYLSHYISSAD